MSPLPYLVRLHERLRGGLLGLAEERVERHRRFLLAQQQPDGGFRGREGGADLYYSAFAVRGLGLLGGTPPESWRNLENWLRGFDRQRLGVIDAVNWLSLALAVQLGSGTDLLADLDPRWREEFLARLEQLRRPDGGYAKGDEGAAGSTYHSFLMLLMYDLLGVSPPRPNALIQFFYDRQRDDGGFVEIAPMRRSGTNPTAAATAALGILGALDDELRDDVRGFLIEARGDDGGFPANSRIPFSDGLSTFTGLLTAHEVGSPRILDVDEVRRLFEGELEFPTGGFRAATWDAQADVEYTFYGLGVLALLAE